MADKKFILQFDAKMELSKLTSDLNTFKNLLKGVQLPDNATKNFAKVQINVRIFLETNSDGLVYSKNNI